MNNRSRPPRNYCLYITGFAKDTERRILKSEFSKFGHVEKLFLDQAGAYAKVTYAEKVSGDKAISELGKFYPDWKIEFFDDSFQKFDRGNFQKPSGTSRMASYNNYYDDDEDFSENYDYCNIHGQPLTVLQADSGDLYVNLRDIKRTGFALFRKDNFNSVLVDKRQIDKEFDLHLLSEAKNYIIKNKVAVIDEETILQTIQRCKSKLLGENTEHKNNFGVGRFVAPSPKNNVIITSDVEIPSNNAKLPMMAQAQNQRPPKTLPNNFMPTNSQRNEGGFKGRGQGQYGIRPSQNNTNKSEREYENETGFLDPEDRNQNFVNGFDTPRTEQKEHNINVSNSSDSKNSYKKYSQPRNGNGQRRAPGEDIGKLTFQIGQTYDVQVVYTEKENIYWVQEKDQNVLEEMFIKINEMEAGIEPVDPENGQLVIALFEEAWNRGRVIGCDPVMVHFIDFGNKCEVQSVKPLPDVFKKTPALAARITNNKVSLNEMAQVRIMVKTEYDDGTYLVDVVDRSRQIKDNETRSSRSNEARKPEPLQEKSSFEMNTTKPSEVRKPEPPQEKFYFEIPKPLSILKHGDKVMVIDTEDNKFLLRTKECALKSKELSEYIRNLDKSALTLTNVKVGQLVLCSKDGLIGLYRAVITKKESGSVVTVKYIDFPGEDDLSTKSLRNVDEFLAREPSSMILSPVHKALIDMNETVAEYISKLCLNKEKCVVVLAGNDFELQFDDGILLSERIQELTSPKPSEAVVKPIEEKPSISKGPDQKEEKFEDKRSAPTEANVLYEDMDWIKIDPGTHTFMCYCLQDISDITMIATTEEVITYLEQITDLEVADGTLYKPQEFEMCLVSFKGPEDESASWYRAVVLEIEGDGYFVNFVDFGNKETVKCQEIRKFPINLKKIPILGVNCKCVGIPNTPEILEQMKKLIPEGEQVEVVVKNLNELAYEIEIPDVYKQLKSKGLY